MEELQLQLTQGGEKQKVVKADQVSQQLTCAMQKGGQRCFNSQKSETVEQFTWASLCLKAKRERKV